MERSKNNESIQTVFEAFLKQNGILEKYHEQKIINNWNQIVGNNIAKATTQLFFSKKTLHISIRSSVIRQELLMHKTELLSIVNSYTSISVVNEIIIH